jgi:hypothetical protein
VTAPFHTGAEARLHVLGDPPEMPDHNALIAKHPGAPQRAADTEEMGVFVGALFPYADDGTFVSLRAFDQHDRGKPPVIIETCKVNGDPRRIAVRAAAAATRAANAEAPAVFAPPVATFRGARGAKTTDLANGVALSVDLDQGNPAEACTKLEGILGPCTVIVASGGEYTDPETGEVRPKRHLHWRLSEPTRTPEDHAKLRETRWLAAVLVGADTTAASVVHPLRWPGSWNRKAGAGRMARITGGIQDAEIHLEDALERLQEAIEGAGLPKQRKSIAQASGEPQAPLADVAAALAHIPNNATMQWDDWNRIGMATWRATGGDEAGLEAWSAWSAKSPKHDGEACLDRWNHFATSPPSKIGAGTLFFLARAAGWVRARPRDEPPPHDEVPEWHRGEAEADLRPEEQQAKPEQKPPERGKRIGKLLLRSVADAAAAPPRDYYLKGLISPGELSLWWGDGGAGKTFFLLYMAYMLSLGRQVFGRRVKPVRVLYLGLEGEGGIEQRIEALRREHGDAEGFAYVAQPVNLFSDEAAIADVKEAIRQHGAGIVFVDTLNRAIGEGSESGDSDMGRLRSTFDQIRYETSAHVAVVHHGGKDEARGPRGHSGLLFATDVTVKLAEGEMGSRSATVTRVKDGESGAVIGFKLRKIELGIDEDGDPIETAIAEETDTPAATAKPGKGSPKLHAEAVSLFQHITDAVAEGLGENARPEPGMPLVPTLSRDVMNKKLIHRGWLKVSTRLSRGGKETETLADRESDRLWGRLNALQNAGFLGFNRYAVWLAKAAATP